MKSPKLPEPSVSEVMESRTTNKNYPVIKEPKGKVPNKDELMKLFDQFSSLISPTSGCLEPDTTISIS